MLPGSLGVRPFRGVRRGKGGPLRRVPCFPTPQYRVYFGGSRAQEHAIAVDEEGELYDFPFPSLQPWRATTARGGDSNSVSPCVAPRRSWWPRSSPPAARTPIFSCCPHPIVSSSPASVPVRFPTASASRTRTRRIRFFAFRRGTRLPKHLAETEETAGRHDRRPAAAPAASSSLPVASGASTPPRKRPVRQGLISAGALKGVTLRVSAAQGCASLCGVLGSLCPSVAVRFPCVSGRVEPGGRRAATGGVEATDCNNFS